MTLWPFMPVGEVIEVLEWKTDVLRARAGEQRHRLRERPRRQWNFNHLFTAEDQSAARAIVRGATGYVVPDWIKPVYGGPVSAGSSVSVSMTTAGTGLAAGQSVVLFSSIADCEVCTVESVSPSAIVLALVVTARASTAIYRADRATGAIEFGLSRPAGPRRNASVSFTSPAVDVYVASSFGTYRGHDLLTTVPVVGSGALAEGTDYPFDVFDNGSGLISSEKVRDLPDDRFTMRWHVFTPADIAAVRAWIASRYGRWLAFWHTTWEKDLTVAADITAIATTLRVFAPRGATSLGRTTFDLEIGIPSQVLRRQVTAVSAGPTVSGRPTFDLTLDSALGTACTAANFGRVSFLRCARFNADRIEFLHRPGEGLAVSIPCIEVPVP